MRFDESLPPKLDINHLIKDLLGLDAEVLASIVPEQGRNELALLGLGAFFRRVLELALQLRDTGDAVLRLREAQVDGEQAANLEALFVWALIQNYRERKHLPHAILELARTNVAAPPIVERFIRRMPLADLIAQIQRLLPDGYTSPKSKMAAATHVHVCEITQSLLGLDPMTLRFYRTHDDRAVGADDLANLACTGLRLLLRDSLSQFAIMRERDTTSVRLMSDDDAIEARIPSARAAHIATLLAAALHADADHVVNFIAPRTRSKPESAMLREAAKAVYLDYTLEGHQGLELICDGIVHFGHGDDFTIADRLLDQAERDGRDPELRHVPYSVSRTS